MQIVYLTAGAAGMYCGSCLHDNALAKALIAAGHDALLVPTYTPILTDEKSVARDQLFYGGLNVYLQQIIPLARWIPRWADRFLSSPKLVGWIAARSMGTTADKLGGLTVSMLQGKHGNQAKEVDRLVDWLATEMHPDVLVFSNLLIGGAIPEIRRRVNCPVVVVLQGDDAFFDQLSEPYRSQSMQLLRELAQQVDMFLVHSRAYGERMQERLGFRPDQWQVNPLSLDTKDFVELTRQPPTADKTPVVGYLARLAPEKGLHVLVDAYLQMVQRHPTVRLEIAGWLGPQHHDYWEDLQKKLSEAGLADRVHYWGSVDRAGKLDFLRSIDLLCVPAIHFEPKGLFVLEALAAGVPVVLPEHAAFPELIERLGGGHLVPAGNIDALAQQLLTVINDLPAAFLLGSAGRSRVLTEATTQLEAVRFIEIVSALKPMASEQPCPT